MPLHKPLVPRLEHIGIAVHDAELVTRLYKSLFGVSPYQRETVQTERIRTHFFSVDTAKLELLESLAPDSAVGRFLAKRGEGLHHLAFEVENIHAEMKRLRSLGFTPLSDTPQPGADGKLIFFLHPKQTHGVLVEFCQQSRYEFHRRKIPFRTSHLSVHTAGSSSNPPVLLLHGGLGSVQLELAPLMQALATTFFVIGINQIGHADSGPIPQDSNLQELGIDQVHTVLDAFELTQAVLFGFSMGGSIALHATHALPHRISKLVILGVNYTWNKDTINLALERIDPDNIRTQAPIWADRLRLEHGNPRWERLARWLQMLIRFHTKRPPKDQVLHNIHTPTLVCAGDRDRLYPLEHTLHLYRQIPESSLAILPDVEHDMQHVNPRAFADLMRQFIR